MTVVVYGRDYCNGDIVIPEKVEYEGVEYTVTNIGGFWGCSLNSITIPKSVTTIVVDAFASGSSIQKVIVEDIAAWCNIFFEQASNPLSCSGHLYSDENTEIKDLIIPNSVTSIANYAFRGCSGLTSVTIPNSVTSIGNYAFVGCSSLTSIVVESGNSVYDSRDNCNAIIETNTNTLITGCQNTVIPNSVTSIGELAFLNCNSLTSVTIPNSVTSIRRGAFQNCSGLTSVSIGNSVTSIGERAFYGCSNLTSVTIPNSVTSIGDYAFYGCSGLTSVTIPNSVTSIGDYAFYGCSGLTSVTIGNSVTSIGKNAFSSCSGLTSVHITDLDAWCNISFGNYYANPLLYAHHLFLNGEEVKDLVIPNSVTSIGNFAFYGCSGLTSVTIPNSVTSIGNGAFSGCSGLTEVVSLIEEPFGINKNVWSSVRTSKTPLYVPAGTKEKYEAAEGWNVFTNIIEMGIAPSEGEDINYGGGEISGETNLNGNVVGNIYYNIGDENGEYSSAEGCITLRTPVSDEQMSQVEGMDLFGEDMKNNFTGIIFMVQAGSGTIKVNAETTGNMVLKVKVGSGKPMEFTLSGKLDAKLPYEVSKPTYVYIYGGSSSEAGAKGVRKAAGDGEVKIYGISWTSGTNGIKTIDNGQLTIDNSPVYNLNGQRVISSPSGRPGGVPTKGIYIKNGKKVLVK